MVIISIIIPTQSVNFMFIILVVVVGILEHRFWDYLPSIIWLQSKKNQIQRPRLIQDPHQMDFRLV